jgi:hypothetical protein
MNHNRKKGTGTGDTQYDTVYVEECSIHEYDTAYATVPDSQHTAISELPRCESCLAVLDGPYCGSCGTYSGIIPAKKVARVRVLNFTSLLVG